MYCQLRIIKPFLSLVVEFVYKIATEGSCKDQYALLFEDQVDEKAQDRITKNLNRI